MSRGRVLRFSRRAVVIALVGLWLVTLRPQWLGGPAVYLIVRGDSMLPTYQDGDLLLLSAQVDYRVGDAVGYRVPAGEVGAGRIVVHRLVDQSGDQFVVRGDNNPAPDPLRPSRADIVGRVLVAVPGAGRLIALLLSPVVAGALAAALVVMISVARSPAVRGDRQAVSGTPT